MAKVRVMIVEDEAIVSMGLRYKLEDLGYCAIAEISSGEEAVIAVSRLHPDLVLMDIRLGGKMNGVDAAALIREQCDVPVVYLTAYVDEATMERAEATEPFGYLLKLFDEATLRSTVEMAVQWHKTDSGRTSRSLIDYGATGTT